MALFNFFGENEHRVFDYKPVYYDKAEEERKRMFGAVDGSEQKRKEDGAYVPGSYIQGAFRDGAYKSTRTPMRKTQTIIGIITLLLICAVLYFIAKYFSIL